MDTDFELGVDGTNPRVESESNRVDSASVHLISPSDNSTAVTEGSMDSVSAEGNVSDVNNRGAADSNKSGVSSDRSHGSVKRVKNEHQKVQRRKELKSKETVSSLNDSILTMSDDFAGNGGADTEVRSSMEVSPGHGYEVGDMVWGKVKSHPWWPGHVYSEEFATPAVRRSKRDGLLLVAFFGDSSYGWFDPSELMPFDSNFSEKSCQTNSKTFVKAVEEAVDEVSRRSALGLSCMCRNKQNFRKTDVQGYFAVDVPDYDPGAVYSIDAIEKARDSFQPISALDFVRQLALEPTGSEHAGIDFMKNKASVISYRRAVYEEFDETYAQAFGYQPVRPSPGSVQELPAGRTPTKAPLSGRQVFADTSGKGKSSTKPNKPKDQAKKDKYLFKRRDDSKDVKLHQMEKTKVTSSSPQLDHVEDSVEISAGDFVLQKRVLATDEQVGTPVAVDKLSSKDASMEDTNTSFGLVDDKSLNSGPGKIVAPKRAENGPKKVKVSKRPVGELGSGKSVLSEKKKKRKKEPVISDGMHTLEQKPVQSSVPPTPPIEVPHGPDNVADLQRALGDLHSLALDPFNTINKGSTVKTRKVFIKFRSLVFQKSLNLSAATDDEGNDTNSSKSPAPENGPGVTPVKPQAGSTNRPYDPTKGGRKRGPSDRQEEIAAKKKKKVGDIKNLTKEKVLKKADEPVKQPVVMNTRKSGREYVKKTDQRAPEPAMIVMKFPSGGSLPSINELKARFARYGPMDHSATRIFWNTFTCRVVYRDKAHARAAYSFVVGSSNLFGNTDVKCSFKLVGDSEPPIVKVLKEDPSAMEDKPLKSCLKKPGGEEVAGNGGRGIPPPRVKFMLGGEESEMKNKNSGASSFSSSSSTTTTTTTHAKMDYNSKNFQRGVLPLPNSTTSITNSSTQFTRPPPLQPPLVPPPNSMNYGTLLAPPPPPPLPLPPRSLNYGMDMATSKHSQPQPPPPPTGNFVHNLESPNIGPPKVDISEQMLSLLKQCHEVVTNVTNMLGYVPYHPL